MAGEARNLTENNVRVKIDNVRKVFNTRNGEMVALNGVSLDIHNNEFICVVGPSGCGKSTLLNIIAGLTEPTSGTDPIARREFWRRITDLSQNGTTIVVTTHFMEEAEYCDRIVIQDAGKVLALGTPSEVRHFNGQSYATMDEAFIGIVEMARGQGRKA